MDSDITVHEVGFMGAKCRDRILDSRVAGMSSAVCWLVHTVTRNRVTVVSVQVKRVCGVVQLAYSPHIRLERDIIDLAASS